MRLYNTLTREKEEFVPIIKNRVGMYVCGPTVYGSPHLGHARPSITFDILFRLLLFKGFSVRYVRNITDVGHLENDADVGEDKICKKARIEDLEPMEIATKYTNEYRDALRELNTLPPSIEPMASGHIIEQIEFIKKLLSNGYAYESKGSVYFDIEKYDKKYSYGELSKRRIEDQLNTTREGLDGTSDKRHPLDFALWKRAEKEHIMRWASPWSDGFPGWHLECSAMSEKYLGASFDIHGGGLDLMFPHHECEIAQTNAVHDCDNDTHASNKNLKHSAKYWVHNNMITINGQKMGKSLGNFITLNELFEGEHKLLEQSYSPMTIRLFILQAHYRSTLDFSNEALKASQKGLERLENSYTTLKLLKPTSNQDDKDGKSSINLLKTVLEYLEDDLNTPLAIASLFETVKRIFLIKDGKESITEESLEQLKKEFDIVVFELLGLSLLSLSSNNSTSTGGEKVDSLMNILINMRTKSKTEKNFTLADEIRDQLLKAGIELVDTASGTDWKIK